MQRLRGVQERAGDAQALHARDRLAAHQAALADAADQELAARFVGGLDALHGLEEAFSRDSVRLVESRDVGERGGGGGENVDGAREEGGAFRVVDGGRRRERFGAALALEGLGRRRGFDAALHGVGGCGLMGWRGAMALRVRGGDQCIETHAPAKPNTIPRSEIE